MPLVSFDTPKNIRKPLVFWCFQGISKETTRIKWVKTQMNLIFVNDMGKQIRGGL